MPSPRDGSPAATRATPATPGLPGTQRRPEIPASPDRRRTSACSRAPLPITRTLMPRMSYRLAGRLATDSAKQGSISLTLTKKSA